MGKPLEGDHRARLTEVLTTVKSVNRTDAASLMGRFGSLAKIAQAPEEELLKCPGLGDTKVKRLHHVFHTPFFPESAAAQQ
mmetsp:Transcript_73203/g.169821  ORF Transcript_73203/g.169821 Transcript_73203/m.169821 type:complete len:81 (-) Transcript_73203:57-299(-)